LIPVVPGVEIHPDCEAAYRHAAELLTKAGHEVDELEMPAVPDMVEAYFRVWSVMAAGFPVDEDCEELLTPFTRYLRELGAGVSGVEFVAGLEMFRGAGQLLADGIFSGYDVLLTPTLARPPAGIGEFFAEDDPTAEIAAMAAFTPYTPLYNVTGLPAISIPLHWNDAGLPIGIMVGGGYGDEATLISLSAQLEEMGSQKSRHPTLWHT
jgi:amidase